MVSANKTSLTPLLFTEVPVPSKNPSLIPLLFTEVPVPSKNRIMYLFVRGIDFAFVYDFSSGFWNCSYTGIFCFSFDQIVSK